MVRVSRSHRHRAAIGGALTFIAILAATLVAGRANAVTGIVDVTVDTSSSGYGPAPSKTKTATCPTGTRIIGGGGGVLTSGPIPYGLVITQMQPVRPLFGGQDFYEVTVNDPSGTIDDWGVRATAICAPALANMSIAYGATVQSSDAMQRATATCPSGRKVVGNGASVYNAYGHAGLQVVRASTDGTRVYAQAHEDAAGYNGDWNVFAWAVCATEPAGYEIVMEESPQSDSERTKNASLECPDDKTLLSAGAATSFSAPAEVALHFALAFNAPTWGVVEAFAAENASTTADWDFIVAQGICAT